MKNSMIVVALLTSLLTVSSFALGNTAEKKLQNVLEKLESIENDYNDSAKIPDERDRELLVYKLKDLAATIESVKTLLRNGGGSAPAPEPQYDYECSAFGTYTYADGTTRASIYGTCSGSNEELVKRKAVAQCEDVGFAAGNSGCSLQGCRRFPASGRW